ncbi:MAG: hypothetical protein V8T12_05790 [Parabacteroides johnsonii]
MRFNSILIRRGNFRYDVKSAASTPGKFNAKHIDIQNLSAKISLKAFNKDSLNANIKKMSFDEASGFDLDKLVAEYRGQQPRQCYHQQLRNQTAAHGSENQPRPNPYARRFRMSPSCWTVRPSN